MPFQSRYALEEKKFNEEKCSSAEMKMLALLRKFTSRDLLRLPGQRGRSIDTNRRHVLHSSSLLLAGHY